MPETYFPNKYLVEQRGDEDYRYAVAYLCLRNSGNCLGMFRHIIAEIYNRKQKVKLWDKTPHYYNEVVKFIKAYEAYTSKEVSLVTEEWV